MNTCFQNDKIFYVLVFEYIKGSSDAKEQIHKLTHVPRSWRSRYVCNELIFIKLCHDLHSVVVYKCLLLITGGETTVEIRSQTQDNGGFGN